MSVADAITAEVAARAERLGDFLDSAGHAPVPLSIRVGRELGIHTA